MLNEHAGHLRKKIERAKKKKKREKTTLKETHKENKEKKNILSINPLPTDLGAVQHQRCKEYNAAQRTGHTPARTHTHLAAPKGEETRPGQEQRVVREKNINNINKKTRRSLVVSISAVPSREEHLEQICKEAAAATCACGNAFNKLTVQETHADQAQIVGKIATKDEAQHYRHRQTE